jgi:hypothetical protein
MLLLGHDDPDPDPDSTIIYILFTLGRVIKVSVSGNDHDLENTMVTVFSTGPSTPRATQARLDGSFTIG